MSGWDCNCTKSSGARRQKACRDRHTYEAATWGSKGMKDRADQRKAIVLLSGGMDSCVCTAIAHEQYGAGNIALLHARYGQRTQQRERRAFEQIADFYGVKLRLVA